MSISFKEFSDILEKKSGTFGAKAKKATYKKDTSVGKKGVKAVAPGGGSKSPEGKFGGGLTFGGSKGGKKPVVKKPEKKPEKKVNDSLEKRIEKLEIMAFLKFEEKINNIEKMLNNFKQFKFM